MMKRFQDESMVQGKNEKQFQGFTLEKEEVDDFLRAKGYAKNTVRNTSLLMRMLDKMDIRTKEAVWDRYYNYTSSYRSDLRRAIVLTNELCSYKKG
jgi:hypothetical protein